jgi:hypothetical protein
MSNLWYSRTNGAALPGHKNFGHESLRGDLTSEKPRTDSKKASVFISKNTVAEAKEAAAKQEADALDEQFAKKRD